MQQKVWKERHIYFSVDTKAIIAPNEALDGIVLTLAETVENKESFRAYLSYDEAKELANQIISFVEENK